jgi:hypothetical protein
VQPILSRLFEQFPATRILGKTHAGFIGVPKSPHLSVTITRTGPSSPDGIKGVSLVNSRMLVWVTRSDSGKAWSPMIRLAKS